MEWVSGLQNDANYPQAFLFKLKQRQHPFSGPFSRTTRVSRYQKGKPIWILLKQETVTGSGKSAPHSRHTTMPASHHPVFKLVEKKSEGATGYS